MTGQDLRFIVAISAHDLRLEPSGNMRPPNHASAMSSALTTKIWKINRMLDADRKMDKTGKPKGNKLAPTERAQLLRELEALTQQKEAIQRGRSRTPPPSTSRMPLQQQTSAGDASTSNASADFVCKVCYAEARTHACIPCGHLCLCLDCANRLWECPELPGCPVCRNLVTEFQRIYPV